MRFLFRACQLTPRSAAGSAMNASKHHGQVPHGRPVAIRHRHVELIEGTRTASCSIAIADTLIAIPQRTSQFPQRARSPARAIFQFAPLEQVLTQLHPATPCKRLAWERASRTAAHHPMPGRSRGSLEAADVQRLRCNWEFRAAGPCAITPANSHCLWAHPQGPYPEGMDNSAAVLAVLMR